MFSHKVLYVLAALAMSGFCVRGADVATTNAVPAADDYVWLTPKTLPPPGPMIEAALAALPKTATEKADWLKRMHKAVWMPSLELHYSVGESGFRNFVVVPGQTVGTTLDPATDSGSRSYATSDSTRWVNQYGVYLTWDLSKLLFRQEEISVAQIELNRQALRDNVRDQVAQTYYDLKESVLLLQNDTYKDSLPTRIRKERLAFLLDTLTAGAFSARAGHKAP